VTSQLPCLVVNISATERLEHELQRVSKVGLGQSINVAGYRQIAIAISRRWIRKGMENGADKHDDGDLLEDDPSGDIADEQATHSPHVAGAVYARDTQELAGGSRPIERRKAVSSSYHKSGDCFKP
jgi:hypothetical protein